MHLAISAGLGLPWVDHLALGIFGLDWNWLAYQYFYFTINVGNVMKGGGSDCIFICFLQGVHILVLC